MSRIRSVLAVALFAVVATSLSACCQKGECIKDPPCKQCEKPSGS